MQVLDTLQLQIIALDLRQLQTWVYRGQAAMERQLGLRISGQRPDARMQRAMERRYRATLRHPDRQAFYTAWLIVLRKENLCIGWACFKGRPNPFGEVELGYGLYAPYRGHGYMREAALALCDWALAQREVRSVIAYTDPDNLPSQHVLLYSGMQMVGPMDDGLLWRLSKEGA